ncbi:hypothetical protein JW868_01155 [Candidatus Woesearchaeota archaeon]|nr:hypothetical protein [Candidatus Woesearchaeota archaeon]
MKICRDARQAQRLDRHINEFLKHMKDDAKKHDLKDLRIDAEEFERHVHSEIMFMFETYRKELELYKRILKSLHRFKAEMELVLNKNPDWKTYARSEMKYVDLLVDSIHHKFDSFESILRRMK